MLGTAAIAQARTYGGGTVVAPPNPAPGGTMQISGTGFAPNSPITVTIGGTTVTRIVTNASGNWTATVSVPSGAGTYTVTATDGVTTARTTFMVAAGSGSAVLPSTGSSSSLKLTQIGTDLVALGALTVFGVRNRTNRRSKVDTLS